MYYKSLSVISPAIIILVLLHFLTACNHQEKQKQPQEVNSSQQNSTAEVSKDMLNMQLERSALDGQLEQVKELLVKGAQVNHINENGSTALMLAAYNGHTKIVELLIKHGGQVNVLDVNKRSALIYASSGPFPETVEILLKNGADVNVVDNVEKFSALMFAAAEGQTEVVKLLLDYGADKNLKDIDGDGAYEFASSNGHNETAVLIKNYK